MAVSRKQIAFDLSTNALQEHYPGDNWRNAYEIIKRHMTHNGFNWQQGSVYVSAKPMLLTQVANIVKSMVKEHPWLNVCMRDCVQANISNEHSLNQHFDPTLCVDHNATQSLA